MTDIVAVILLNYGDYFSVIKVLKGVRLKVGVQLGFVQHIIYEVCTNHEIFLDKIICVNSFYLNTF